MDETGCSRIEVIGSSKDASSKNREVTQADTRRNAKKGIRAWRIIGFARVEGRLPPYSISASLFNERCVLSSL
jgi:hypothetical protein